MSKPQLRDVILRGSNAGWVKGGFSEGELGRDQGGRRGAVVQRAMTGDREEPVRIDRRLAMLGGNDEERRLKEALLLQFAHHLADAGIDKLDFLQHCGSRSFRRVRISALDAGLDQL